MPYFRLATNANVSGESFSPFILSKREHGPEFGRIFKLCALTKPFFFIFFFSLQALHLERPLQGEDPGQKRTVSRLK